MVCIQGLAEVEMASDQISLKLFLRVLGVILLTELAAGWLIQGRRSHSLYLIGLLRIFQTGGILVLLVGSGEGLDAIGLRRGTLRHGFYRGILWSMGVGVLTLLGFGILFILGQNPLTFFHAGVAKDGATIAAYLAVGVVIGPVAEEILFRGIVYGFLRKWGVLFALYSSTLLFASLHGLSSGIPLIQIVGGLLFALSYEKERSLWPPIIIHVMGNGAIFTLALINRIMV